MQWESHHHCERPGGLGRRRIHSTSSSSLPFSMYTLHHVANEIFIKVNLLIPLLDV
jgi:hypothetical protein